MIIHVRNTLCSLLVLLLVSFVPLQASTTTNQSSATWPTDYLARLEALALLQTLNAELLSNDSATRTLQRWCTTHRLAANPRIVAERVGSDNEPPTEHQLRELAVSASGSVRHRKVRLICGSTVLSEADNWYVPARLTPQMNQLLEATNLPFGTVVQELRFRRHIVAANLVWSPLPDGWEVGSASGLGDSSEAERPEVLPLPPRVLVHRAILTLPDGTPFSEVVESYTGNVLAFPCPSLPEIVVLAKKP